MKKSTTRLAFCTSCLISASQKCVMGGQVPRRCNVWWRFCSQHRTNVLPTWPATRKIKNHTQSPLQALLFLFTLSTVIITLSFCWDVTATNCWSETHQPNLYKTDRTISTCLLDWVAKAPRLFPSPGTMTSILFLTAIFYIPTSQLFHPPLLIKLWLVSSNADDK